MSTHPMKKDSAESRAVCYRFLAQLLLRDPKPEMLRGLSGIDKAEWPGRAESNCPAGTLVQDGLREMADSLSQAAEGDARAICLELSRQRMRLFRGLAPGYGTPPPYEALHRADRVQSEMEILLEVQNIFAEAGIEPAEGRTDRPDFLGLELELMGFLCGEEARCREQGDHEGAGRAGALQQKLLRNHLLRWVPSYCALLRTEAVAGFYSGFSKVLEGFLADEALGLSTDQGISDTIGIVT